MPYGIDRQEGLELLKAHVASRNLVNHCLAAEAVLRATAQKLGEDVEKWGLAGLLHDLDVETQTDLDTHTRETVEILEKIGVNSEIVEAVRLHNTQAWPGEKRTSPFHHAVAAGETITGLIIAAALVNPARKLSAVKPKSVKKRYKEKAFARGADREIIAECELAGIPLAEFCELSLAAMQDIAGEIGL
ncbi:HDIG domain-containing metalloprotein [Desulforhopalus singaporensis]|uniref:HDIG domain-containing protein n=1 Tax=Desulforhopalus singaporensis TaxID=91360 RepID=A0A1H0J7B6_9BACT|nr:HDIG domain-containing metalloprotein [Desulforhopalus singaporensis]SDO39369.1 HDIG domain-containing protein [Desulforhopalus singaporensis]